MASTAGIGGWTLLNTAAVFAQRWPNCGVFCAASAWGYGWAMLVKLGAAAAASAHIGDLRAQHLGLAGGGQAWHQPHARVQAQADQQRPVVKGGGNVIGKKGAAAINTNTAPRTRPLSGARACRPLRQGALTHASMRVSPWPGDFMRARRLVAAQRRRGQTTADLRAWKR